MNIRLIAASLILCAGTAFAFVPPTDEQVNALVEKVQGIKAPANADAAARQATAKERGDAIREGLASISLAEATLPQIEKLSAANVLSGNGAALNTLAPRLAELAKAPTVDGARAAELRIVLQPPYVSSTPASTPAERTKANEARAAAFVPLYTEVLNHPAMLDLVKSGKGDRVILGFANLQPDAIKQGNLLASVERLLVPEMSIDALAGFGAVVIKVSDSKVVSDPAERNRMLDKIASVGQSVLDRTGTAAGSTEVMARRARETVLRAKSSFARGELMNGPAPEVSFTWSSDGKLKNISELKGNVVVLDFWATWCGPCVATFPKIHELVERYQTAGSPVKVIGVTSLQGFHMKRTADMKVKPERIDCKDDTSKEYGLMPEFMKDLNMNWTVAFTPDGCFNPNFGVNGIPHLVIIDAAGKVRHNGLHPANAKDVADKIDALLKEANLKAPAEPMPAPEKDKKVSQGN